jgi:gliding motility-associated-like protein
LPIVSAGLDAAICKGDSTHLLATGADTYVWTPAAGLNNNSIANPSASPGSSTNYTVVGTNTVTGCTKADVVIVTTSTIQATLSADPIAGDAPLTVTFGTNGGASSYHWNYGNGTILNAGDTTQTIYVNQGTYTASVIETSAAGCKDSAYIIILVSEGYSIVIPNIITPNGDNTNDYFFVKHQGISALEMVIYDRWGLQMWQSSSLNGTWDGRHGGKEVPDGTYFYLIKATSSKANTTKEYQGFITLIK